MFEGNTMPRRERLYRSVKFPNGEKYDIVAKKPSYIPRIEAYAITCGLTIVLRGHSYPYIRIIVNPGDRRALGKFSIYKGIARIEKTNMHIPTIS
jgi:hypothetical protein